MTNEQEYIDWLKLMHFMEFLRSEDIVTNETYQDMTDALMTLKTFAVEEKCDLVADILRRGTPEFVEDVISESGGVAIILDKLPAANIKEYLKQRENNTKKP